MNNYLNTFFTKYIIIFFFRYNNDVVFSFKKTSRKFVENFTIIF